jgi:hypothetical protein
MAITIHAESAEAGVRERVTALAKRVIAAFEPGLPLASLLCFVDGQEWESLRTERGFANRGFYGVFKYKEPPWLEWPQRIVERVLIENPRTGLLERCYDHFIYLHQSTAATDVGLVMTFAHELQHFIQHQRQPKLWAESTVATSLTREIVTAYGLSWADIPIEYEARLVAKRVSEGLFGHDAVARYIDSQIAANVTTEDAADWKFVRSLEPGASYDMENAGATLYGKLQGLDAELADALASCREMRADPAFDLVEIGRLDR